VPTKTIASGTVADAYLQDYLPTAASIISSPMPARLAPIIESYAKGAGARLSRAETDHGSARERRHQHGAGYYLMTGRPQAVMVHVNVGTANAMCGLINSGAATSDAVHVGRTPYAEEGGLPGERSGEIHWPQEMRDQRAIGARNS